MELVFLGIIIFIFVLAVFDLSVGVSNDAVNFLNSAIGARAAKYRTVIIIAAIGIFLGAVMSNGMMDIARHGIFRPEHFSFFDLMCIFMAVMVTDIILLDTFNSLGLPTSTTVSMVFELLGASFAVSVIKLSHDTTGLSLVDMLNTEKALSVILGIFLSVAIAFVFGTLVQYLARLWFSFNYRKGLKWKIGLFGGFSITAIIYFLLLKGAKELTFMTADIKQWISDNTALILVACFVVSSVLCQLLHTLKVNVFKVIVLTGTFALAMAFAGNDLVNFIGVPLSGFSSYQDYVSNGGGQPEVFMMDSLNSPASTPLYFLIGAGLIMIISLAFSKKAKKVVDTSVNLSRQDAGDEMFGSSRLARRLVRISLNVSEKIVAATPTSIKRWIGRRFNTDEAILEEGAAFDLVRGSINLVLAGALIALGTSWKLPLSTTYVTFMVAMGTSLADRAWGRESAVFRITGVISVIGGWFITAVVAFMGAGIVVVLMHLGGIAAIVLVTIVAMAFIVYRNISKKMEKEKGDNALFQTILACENPADVWHLLKLYIVESQREFVAFAIKKQQEITDGFFTDNCKMLGQAVSALAKQKPILKCVRRKSTLCFRKLPQDLAMQKSAWFFLSGNAQMSMLYNLRRIAEMCHEHVDNNFRPLPESVRHRAEPLCRRVNELLGETMQVIDLDDVWQTVNLRRKADKLKEQISVECRTVHDELQQTDAADMTVLYVYLNMMQEQQEMLSSLRKLLRADYKLMSADPASITACEQYDTYSSMP